MGKKDAEIYSLQNQVWRLESEVAILRDQLDLMRERAEEADPLRRAAKRHEDGTLSGQVLTAETFGTLVQRFLDLEALVIGDDNA